MYKNFKKKIDKGVVFFICVFVNNIVCYFLFLVSDEFVFVVNDIVKM